MTRPIWPGSSSFVSSSGQTPFGFYDTDVIFNSEVDNVAKWCAIRLGYPIVNVELQSGSFYAAFEEAITTYGNEIYQYKIRENYLSLEGNSTGSTLNDQLIVPSLGSIIRIAKNYGSEAGTGGTVNYNTGFLPITASVQNYDMAQWARNVGITGSIEIKRIFYESPPAILRYFDPYAGTGTGMQSMLETFGFGQMSPGINFMLMPIYFDVQKVQAIEYNDEVRKAAYSFDLINNKLRLFPIPVLSGSLRFHYIITEERDSSIYNFPSGSSGSTYITNMSKVPYANPVYQQINSIGKQWIRQYTLAIAKEMLGYIRKKYQSIPIPGAEVVLNGDDLINAAITEKQALLEQLRLTLDEVSRKAQLERKFNEDQFVRDTLNSIPLTIYVF